MGSPRAAPPLVVASFLAPNIEPVYRFIAHEMGRRVGRAVEFVNGGSFDDFGAGRTDAGFI